MFMPSLVVQVVVERTKRLGDERDDKRPVSLLLGGTSSICDDALFSLFGGDNDEAIDISLYSPSLSMAILGNCVFSSIYLVRFVPPSFTQIAMQFFHAFFYNETEPNKT